MTRTIFFAPGYRIPEIYLGIFAKSNAVRVSVTTVSLLPASSSKIITHRQHHYGHIQNLPFQAALAHRGYGFLLLAVLFVSSMQTTGLGGVYGRRETSGTSSSFATNPASAFGMHHSFTNHGLISVFS